MRPDLGPIIDALDASPLPVVVVSVQEQTGGPQVIHSQTMGVKNIPEGQIPSSLAGYSEGSAGPGNGIGAVIFINKNDAGTKIGRSKCKLQAIVAHELGHAYKYINGIQQPPTYAKRRSTPRGEVLPMILENIERIKSGNKYERFYRP